MANIKNVFPNVTVETKARTWRNIVDPVSDATVMYVPFYSDRGPVEVTDVYSLDHFIEIYGKPNFDLQGRTALGITNWLQNRGAIKAYRLVKPNAKTASLKIEPLIEEGLSYLYIEAAHPGAYYNQVYLKFGQGRRGYMTIAVSIAGIPRAFLEVNEHNIVSELQKVSDIFGTVDFKLDGVDFEVFKNYLIQEGDGRFSNGEDGDESVNQTKLLERHFRAKAIKTQDDLIEGDIIQIDSSEYVFKKGSLVSTGDGTGFGSNFENATLSGNEFVPYIGDIIEHTIDTKIDVIMDFGYNEEIKKAMIEFSQSSDDGVVKRPDIFYFIEEFTHNGLEKGELVDLSEYTDKEDTTISEDGFKVVTGFVNVALYTQQYLIKDSDVTNKNIWVGPSYFLSKLVPFNDAEYGVQWPLAGLTRGVLTGVISVDSNPSNAEKKALYEKGINYSERDSRGVTFMSQKTLGHVNNALQYINNSRVLNKIVRDVTEIGRKYLFEFNDSYTLGNLSAEANRYIAGWIQNRSLNYGSVKVEPASTTGGANNVVLLNLSIQFNGVIEYINVTIQID